MSKIIWRLLMGNRILVVEDNKTLANLIAKKIKDSLNYEVDVAYSLQETKLFLHKYVYFTTLLDINLPDAPNGEVVDYVLSKNQKAIVLSGNIDKNFREEMLKKNIIDYVNKGERPLALYIFSNNKNHVNQILTQTHSGGVAVNECILQTALETLPFGGIGPSGMGHYHGIDGFKTFSKAKSIFYQSKINGAGLLTPPYQGFTKKLIALITKLP